MSLPIPAQASVDSDTDLRETMVVTASAMGKYTNGVTLGV